MFIPITTIKYSFHIYDTVYDDHSETLGHNAQDYLKKNEFTNIS